MKHNPNSLVRVVPLSLPTQNLSPKTNQSTSLEENRVVGDPYQQNMVSHA